MAPFQTDQTPVGLDGWSVLSYQAAPSIMSDTEFIVSAPNLYDNPVDLAATLYPSSLIEFSTMYMPIRSRLIRLSNSELGPWVAGFIQVEVGPL